MGDQMTTNQIIQSRDGINALDEYGDSPLILAINNDWTMLVAMLLNSRMPMVDVNYRKGNGYTALIYSIWADSKPFLVEMLLRRGADPSLPVMQEGSRGNTALHIACSLGHQQQAELLIK